MLHKGEANLRMDPDSPLNRAHQMERQAERMMLNGRYEQAVACYNRATENLEEAIHHTQNPSALLSLRLQLENLRKQPQVVRKRQQWGRQKQDSVLTVWDGQFLTNDSADGAGERNPACDVIVGGGAEQEGEEEEGRERVDSADSRFNSSEEMDSLLALVQQHFVVEDEQPKYRVAQLLAAFKTLGLGNRQPDVTETSLSGNHSPSEPSAGPDALKLERTVVKLKQLEAYNSELQTHLMQLFQVLDSCQRENEKLKETVADLSQQLEECRAHNAMGEDHFGLNPDSRLDAPFSLIDGFACTPPTESLPPLSPLPILDFDQVEDMS